MVSVSMDNVDVECLILRCFIAVLAKNALGSFLDHFVVPGSLILVEYFVPQLIEGSLF